MTSSAASPSHASGARPPEVRLRLIGYGLFLALAAVAGALLSALFDGNRLKTVHAEVMQHVVRQTAHTQELGRLAALAVAPGHDAASVQRLAEALRSARQDSTALDERIAGIAGDLVGGAGPGAAALRAWQHQRHRLWVGTQALIDSARPPAGASVDEHPDRSPRHTTLEPLGSSVQRDAAAAAVSLGALADSLRGRTAALSAVELERVTLASASALAVLALLTFALTETTARTLRMQHRRGLSQRAELRRLTRVAERMQALVVVTDRYDRIVWVNDAFVSVSGWSLEEARGRTPADLIYSPHAEASTMADIREAFLRGEGTRAELVHRTRDGRELWLEVDIQPVRDENGVLEGFVSVSTDITEQRRTACTDALTGLANRSVLLERLQRALERARRHPEHRFAVLFLDFDRFKQVNDTLGHAAGDELLREVALRLDRTVRPGDAVARIARESHTAARIGGDEFVVLLERTRGVEDAMAAAQRVLAALAAPYSLASQCVPGGVSIGVVTSDITATTAEEVLCDADAAMYEAKRGGRGRCVLFDASMRERRARMRALEQELRWALRDGELDVVYQPVVDLTNDSLVGVEALVRWSPPHRGAVPSEELIRAAEDAGLADDIGQFVITRAVRDYRGWQRQLGDRAPGYLAVNVSRSQLLQPALAEQLKQWLAKAGMEASRLQLEFPERAASEGEGDAVHPALQLLRQLGVRIALDDFGTGHASLASLRQLPLDIVKIDRSLVAQAQIVEHHRVLIEATVRMAHTLGLRTVAEGVETESQAAMMQALACEQGQGWLYSHPMSAQSLERWMSERSELLAA